MRTLFFSRATARNAAPPASAGYSVRRGHCALQEHARLSLADSLKVLSGDRAGLAFDEVLRRLVRNGPNRPRIPQAAPPDLARLARSLKDRRVPVLRRLNLYGQDEALARLVPASLLVPGDIIELNAGDIVPADVRLIRQDGLMLDRGIFQAWPDSCAMGDRVLTGNASALVLATGNQTLLGLLLQEPVHEPQQGRTLPGIWRQLGRRAGRQWQCQAGVLMGGLGVALLALAAPRPAQAAEVSLYGTLDVGIVSTHVRGEGTGSGLISGGQTDSLWGASGRETLAGDAFVSFTLEGGLDAATGHAEDPDRLFNYQSWLGVGSAAWGELRLGRQNTAGQAFVSGIEVAGWKDFGMGALMRAADNYQVSNMLSWTSPLWQGLQAGLSYSPDVGERGFEKGRAHLFSSALQYAIEDWVLVASYETMGRVELGNDRARRPAALQLGLSADFEAARLAAGWSRQRNGFVGRNGGEGPAGLEPRGLQGMGPMEFMDGGRLDAVYAGVAVPFGNDELQLQWSQGRPSWHWRDSSERAGMVRVMSLGYVHSLSPRTTLYGFAALGQRYDLDDVVGADAPRTRRVAMGLTHHF
ncbi:porin [Kerstersia gyiorum]|jgi:predicted porin|uniref:porin n=1 Tax=Kerstersia gyiorum TaxID=206506 RepID=UPI00242CBD9D|nr:porin [Kerstersia gyiorum]MCH4270733.1 porin [Kerstersia gyiorum]MCI1227404.1 porin [Kerstersia gyiorum]